jgi:hypothetical protein
LRTIAPEARRQDLGQDLGLRPIVLTSWQGMQAAGFGRALHPRKIWL